MVVCSSACGMILDHIEYYHVPEELLGSESTLKYTPSTLGIPFRSSK